ncbi:MAG: TonB-dependent receptor, partial [Caldimonas sp.]
TLTPILFYNRARFHRDGTLVQTVGALPAPFDTAQTDGSNSTTLARLNGEWTHRFAGGSRVESRAGVGRTRRPAQSFRTETTGGAFTRSLDDSSDSRDTSVTASSKLVTTIFEDNSLVSGLEFESNRRADTRVTVQRPDPFFTDFGDNLSASSVRVAGYVQDEWNLSPQWAAHAGLRWEGIRTRGSVGGGEAQASNRSSVWSPLLHAVWKPDAKSRDQVRISLTRSYRSPTLSNLIARPTFDTRYPIDGPNTPTQADRAGNPNLKPELATGVDIALERYLPGSGLLSANVFRRNITNYMRSVTSLETVSYSSVPRYVLRPQNVGDAVTQGLELEAKFRVSEVWEGGPKIDVRANASFFASRVKGVPGPDNRLDQQPGLTANLGGDYRFSGMPLSVGGNLNWTPGYTTRLSDVQTAFIDRKLVIDAYGLWVFNPALQLRLSLSNLAASDYVYGGSVDGPNVQGTGVRESSRTAQPTFVNVQLRLEMKL